VCEGPITKRFHSISAQSEPYVSQIFMKFLVLGIEVLPLLCIDGSYSTLSSFLCSSVAHHRMSSKSFGFENKCLKRSIKKIASLFEFFEVVIILDFAPIVLFTGCHSCEHVLVGTTKGLYLVVNIYILWSLSNKH